MRDKKGFTLIELIGVIVILSILMGLAVLAYKSTNVNVSIKYKHLEQSIAIAGREYASRFKDSPILISLQELIDEGYIENVDDSITKDCGDLTKNILMCVKQRSFEKSDYDIYFNCKNYKNYEGEIACENDVVEENKACVMVYLNGAKELDGEPYDKELCCDIEGNQNSCSVTLPTITPKAGFTSLGYTDDGEDLTTPKNEYRENETIEIESSDTEDENAIYAVTKSDSRNTLKINYHINGATSYEIGDNTYTNDEEITYYADYAYNGEALPKEVRVTLPTINRTNGRVYGWDSDGSNEGTPEFALGQEYLIEEDRDLYAITSKEIKVTYHSNIASGNTIVDNLNNHVDTRESFNSEGIVFDLMSYETNSTVCRQAINSYHGYKVLGLNTNPSSSNVEYCFGSRIYLENDIDLYAIWKDIYAEGECDTDGLRFRTGAGTGYDFGAEMKKGDSIYITDSEYKWDGSHSWYPIIYGSKTGWAAGNNSKNPSICTSSNDHRCNIIVTNPPKQNSCSYAYSCTSNNKLLGITPSSFTLNVTSNISRQRLTQNLTINNQCGPITEVISDDSNVVTATTDGVVTGKVNSIPENTTRNVKITYKTKYECSEEVNVTVKNIQANPPTVTISISGNSSTCRDSYLSGAKATIRCVSDVPITSYSAKIGSTPYDPSTSSDGKTKTSTITLKSTGKKTITASCGNSEGSNSTSKSVTIKVYSETSSCGCDTYYTASSAGSSCSRCSSWSYWGVGQHFVPNTTKKPSSKTECFHSGSRFMKYEYKNYVPYSTGFQGDIKQHKCSSFVCKSYKSCCHT